MTAGELNVAVWGLGPHAVKNILPAVAASPGLRLYGVCSRNEAVVAMACREYACAGWHDDELLLGDAGVDVVYVATPIGIHALQGQAVLAAGKHFWCEKPLADNPEQLEPLVTQSRECGLTLAEGFMYLYHPQFETLKRVMGSDQLGRPLTVTCRFGIPPLRRPGFRMDPKLGGGALLDVGVYPISAMDALYPAADPIVAFAEIITASGSPVDSDGRAVLRYPDGCAGVLEWRTGAGYRNEIDVWGTEGSVSSKRIFSKPADYMPEFCFLDGHGNLRYDSVPAANHFVLMLTAFRRLVEDVEMADRERRSIQRRARLVEAIRNHSK